MDFERNASWASKDTSKPGKKSILVPLSPKIMKRYQFVDFFVAKKMQPKDFRFN